MEFFDDGIFEFWNVVYGGVFCFIMVDGVDCCFFDVVWCIEIWFVGVKVNYVYIFGMKIMCFLCDSQGCRGFYM